MKEKSLQRFMHFMLHDFVQNNLRKDSTMMPLHDMPMQKIWRRKLQKICTPYTTWVQRL